MLFQDRSAALVKAAFDGALWAANRDRKKEAAKRLNFYHDGQLEELRAEVKRQFVKPAKLIPAFVNIVRKVIGQLATVYGEEPKRDVDGSEADKALFAEIAEACGLSVRLKTASRYVKLLKTVMVRPVWRGGRLDLDILTPDLLDVETGESPEDVRSVLVTHFPESGKSEEVTYSFWTVDRWARLDWRGQEIDGGPNPYGVLPFIPLWDRAPTSDFWLDGGDDLIVMQESVNYQLTMLLHTMNFQGFGMAYMKGANLDEYQPVTEFIFGPGSVANLPLGSEFGFVSPNAPIEEIVGAIDKLLKWVAITNGLSAASLSTDPSEESGVSKIVGNRELEEMRRDDIALFRQYERRLFQVMRAVWNAHNPGRKLSETASLRVDFADPKPAVSPTEQAKAWDALLTMGVVSPVDVVMERNPDLSTREDALAHLLKLQEEKRALSENQI